VGLASTLYQLSLISSIQFSFEQAEQYATQSLKMAEQAKDQWGIAAATRLLGLYAAQKAEYNNAINLLKSALKISEANGNISGQAIIKRYMGYVYYLSDENEIAEMWLKESLLHHRALGTRPDMLGDSINLLGKIYLIKAQHSKAIELFSESSKIGDNRIRFAAHAQLALHAWLIGNKKSAKDYFTLITKFQISLLPGDTDYYKRDFTYALGFAGLGRYEVACNLYRRAIERCPAVGIIRDAYIDLQIVARNNECKPKFLQIFTLFPSNEATCND